LIRIEADQLVPGRGEPERDAVVLLAGATVTYAGPRADAPLSSGPVFRVKTVLPGLWDCHAHFLGLPGLDLTMLVREPQPVQVARATKAAEAVLCAGFTSVRELGGFGVYLARAVEEGVLAGPSIYGAGAILGQTGGHADLHGMPVALIGDSAEQHGALQLCDGVAECVRAVRLQLRKNARVIKICASGGVLSEVDHPVHQQFSDAELHAIVEEAGRAERVVAAHCHGKPGIMAALRAGCRTIEHGTYLDEEAAMAMREAGAILVSTRAPFSRMMTSAADLPQHVSGKLLSMRDRHLVSMQTAREAGVSVACGTDFSTVGDQTLSPHGRNGEELVALVGAGYSTLAAIEAATANAPATLGPQAPRSGQLRAGFDADVIAVDGDPVADIRVLADPARITHVWRLGRLVKPSGASTLTEEVSP
jgi:imidazolonepropionase-like amidohydrolase